MKQWWNWRKRDAELEKEMQHHLRMAEAERVERGAAPREARAGAQREFGNKGLVKELARDAWGWRWLRDLGDDLRYGYRTLRNSLGFSLIAIATLALGIGANTAIFSLIDAALLRAIPARDAGQLVVLQWKAQKEPEHLNVSSYGDCDSGNQKTGAFGCSLSGPFFREVSTKDELFSSVAAFAGAERLTLSGHGDAHVVNRAEYVSGRYFETLRVNPALGRLLAAGDDAPSAAPAVALSFRYWRSEFGGARDVIGKTILLNRVPFTIVGVVEEQFDALSPGNPLDMWVPLAMAPRLEVPWDNRELDSAYWWLVIVGRLKPEAAVPAARAELTALFGNESAHAYHGQPIFKADDGTIELLTLERGLTGGRKDAAAPLYVLMLVVGVVLLVACANVAGLGLARATSRQKELAVRFALGASKGRMVRQLLTESLMLSCAGGLVGVLFASWCVPAIQNFLATMTDGPLPFSASIDTRVLLFTMCTTLLTGVLFGLAPALRGLRVDLTPALKEGAGSSSSTRRAKRGWFSAGNTLVIAQVALSIVVLAGAGLLVRTLQNLKSVNPGFDTRNILTFSLDPAPIGYKTADSSHFYKELQSRLAGMPGVIAVTYSWRPLLGGGRWSTGFHLEGRPKDEEANADQMSVGPDFFHTMHIALLAGREFDARDFAVAQQWETIRENNDALAAAKLKAGTPGQAATADLPTRPAIINQALVRKYFPNQNPIGRVFGRQDTGEDKNSGWEIEGIVSDAKYDKLRRDVEPTIYIPSGGGGVSFSVRTETDPAKFVPQVRAAVSQMDSNLPVSEIRTESQQIERQIFIERLVARLSGFFGALALLLACIGLYGLVSYEVARRTREIGIRSALGAARTDVLRLVLTEGMRLACVGAGVGIALALVVTRLAKDLLFGVSAADPLTFIFVTLLLFGVTLLACFVPARRATRVDPVVALRCE